MPRGEVYYSEMHAQNDENLIDQLCNIDPLLFNFYAGNKSLIDHPKPGRKSEHDRTIIEILGDIESLVSSYGCKDEYSDRSEMNKDINKIHRKIDKIGETTYRKQLKTSNVATRRIVNNINKMPKYKPMKIKIR